MIQAYRTASNAATRLPISGEPPRSASSSESALIRRTRSARGHFSDSEIGELADSWITPVDITLGDEHVRADSWIVGLRPTPEGRRLIAGEKTGRPCVSPDPG